MSINLIRPRVQEGPCPIDGFIALNIAALPIWPWITVINRCHVPAVLLPDTMPNFP
jgi:hypothetical protein